MGIYENVKELCQKRGIALTKAEMELGFSRGSLGKLKDQKSMNASRLEKISKYFDVPIDYLLTGSEREGFVLSCEELELIKRYRRLSEYNKQIISNTTNALSETSENEISAS